MVENIDNTQPSPAHSHAYNFLVTGANFGNKGAQSMLFVTTSELRGRFPSSTIYFVTEETYPEKEYVFKRIYMTWRIKRNIFGGFGGFMALMNQIARDAAKVVIRHRNARFGHYFDLRRVMPKITAIIDISGFAFSSKWGGIGEGYIRSIELAEKFGVPMYLMPQSFGPFDFPPGVMEKVKPHFSRVLHYPRIIFAREKGGFDSMTEIFGLPQVKLSADLVLQNRYTDPADIFTTPHAITVPKIESSRELAGIVPNMRCFDHGDKDKILSCYREIIGYILSKGYRVVLFRHSREDIEACRMLKEFYSDNEDVVLVGNDFNCFEYSEFIKQFKFLVCSRYHGLVHAGKNGIPCIYLGWAEKYHGLAEILGQSRYVFDITSPSAESSEIIDALSCLLENYDSERRTISERLAEIQKHNCFDILEEDMRGAGIVK